MTVLGPGEKIPRFSAPDQSGYLWDHDDLMGRRSVLFFVPVPRTERAAPIMRSVQDHLADFEALETSVFAIVAQDVGANARFVAANRLSFPVLSDSRRKIADGFGLVNDDGVTMTTMLVGPSGRVQRVYEPTEPRLHTLEVVRDILAMVRPPGSRRTYAHTTRRA